MKIKKNDLVKIIAGRDSGKEGKVIQILRDENRIVVDGINKTIKSIKPTKSDEKGRKIEYFAPIHF